MAGRVSTWRSPKIAHPAASDRRRSRSSVRRSRSRWRAGLPTSRPLALFPSP
uniref:Modification methylase CcrMI-like protein n=1 Tax=uncultured marine virus TaxID=186617 RepID=A0A0F7L794_9VIRU|nr:modification methylase CcrMI-like protein [uncultured marine virus]